MRLARVRGTSLFFQLKYAMNFKTALKNCLLKKKKVVIEKKGQWPLVSFGLGSSLGISTNQLCSGGLFSIDSISLYVILV